MEGAGTGLGTGVGGELPGHKSEGMLAGFHVSVGGSQTALLEGAEEVQEYVTIVPAFLELSSQSDLAPVGADGGSDAQTEVNKSKCNALILLTFRALDRHG